jgi:prepilin-type N-terminal cleavage/methylation domain-containing protein
MARCRHARFNHGFTLVEVMVSLAILIVALVSIAHLLAIGAQADLGARTDLYATVLASQKLEELRADDQPSTSPSDSLSRSVSGFVDYLEPDGRPAVSGGMGGPGWVYVRRWSVQPSEQDGGQTLVVQVFTFPARRPAGSGEPTPLLSAGVRLTTIKRRETP